MKVEPPDELLFFPQGSVKKEVYFMAIIDILTHYDAKKKAAHAAKTVKHGVSVMTSYLALVQIWLRKMTLASILSLGYSDIQQ